MSPDAYFLDVVVARHTHLYWSAADITYRHCFVHLALLDDRSKEFLAAVSEFDETLALRVSEVVNTCRHI